MKRGPVFGSAPTKGPVTDTTTMLRHLKLNLANVKDGSEAGERYQLCERFSFNCRFLLTRLQKLLPVSVADIDVVVVVVVVIIIIVAAAAAAATTTVAQTYPEALIDLALATELVVVTLEAVDILPAHLL